MTVTRSSQVPIPFEASRTLLSLTADELDRVQEMSTVLFSLQYFNPMEKLAEIESYHSTRVAQVEAVESLLKTPKAYRSFGHWQRMQPAHFLPEERAVFRSYFQARFGRALAFSTMENHFLGVARDIEKLQSFSVDYDLETFKYRSQCYPLLPKPFPMKEDRKTRSPRELERVLSAYVDASIAYRKSLEKVGKLVVKMRAKIEGTEYEGFKPLYMLANIAFDLFEFSILAVRKPQIEEFVRFIEGSYFNHTYEHILAHFVKEVEESKEEKKESV